MWKTRAKALPALFLIANSISWFSLTWIVIGNALTAASASFNDILMVSGSYFGALIMSAFIGATLLYKKLRGKTALFSWVLMGALTCLLSGLVPTTNLYILTCMSLAIGSSVGVGIPTCLSIFANYSKTENRGRLGALSFFIIQILTGIIVISTGDILVSSKFMILAIWRLSGAVGILLYKPTEKLPSQEQKTQLFSIIRERTFILYFLPWFMFTLVNFIEGPVLEQFFGAALFDNYMLATTLIASVSALLGGTLCDLKGRKVTGIVGFILLGMGYAILSFFSEGPGKAISQILYVICDGTAWGILYVTFIFVTWGDVSDGKIREKYYLLGGLPFLFSGLIEVLVQPFIGIVNITTSFSLASFFLFVSILPLLYAPETLSEKIMKAREMKTYLQKAQEIASKPQNKKEEDKKCDEDKDDEKETVTFEVNPEDDEKARELAEKYY